MLGRGVQVDGGGGAAIVKVVRSSKDPDLLLGSNWSWALHRSKVGGAMKWEGRGVTLAKGVAIRVRGTCGPSARRGDTSLANFHTSIPSLQAAGVLLAHQLAGGCAGGRSGFLDEGGGGGEG